MALILFLALATVRGAWRGFLREAFALIGLVVGTVAAFRYSEAGAARLQELAPSSAPQAALIGVGFVGIFFAVYVTLSVIGALMERRVASSATRAISTLGGSLVGFVKGIAIAAFCVLFVYLFVPQRSAQLGDSKVARALLTIAGNALRAADPYAAPAALDTPNRIG